MMKEKANSLFAGKQASKPKISLKKTSKQIPTGKHKSKIESKSKEEVNIGNTREMQGKNTCKKGTHGAPWITSKEGNAQAQLHTRKGRLTRCG